MFEDAQIIQLQQQNTLTSCQGTKNVLDLSGVLLRTNWQINLYQTSINYIPLIYINISSMSIKLPVQLIFDHQHETAPAQEIKVDVPVIAPKMRKPISASFEPWSSYPTLPFHFIEDDFVHGSLFALSASLSHARGGVEVNEKICSTQQGPHLQDQTSFWLSLPQGRALYARLNMNDYLKLHLDNGVTRFFGKKVNLYGALTSTHNFASLSWRLGLRHVSKDVHTDCRIKYSTGKKDELNFSTRNVYKNRKLTYGLITMLDLNSWVLNNCNLVLGYKADQKTDIFLRAEHPTFRKKNPECWKGLFDQYLLTAIHAHNPSTTLGAEIALQPKSNPFKWAQLVVEKNHGKNFIAKFKVKASHDSVQGAATVQHPVFSRQAILSLGLHTINPHKQERLFSWGSQLQFNL